MKNGDLIRAMDNEELAEFLSDRVGCCCSDCPCEEFCEESKDCIENISDWLESEAE